MDPRDNKHNEELIRSRADIRMLNARITAFRAKHFPYLDGPSLISFFPQSVMHLPAKTKILAPYTSNLKDTIEELESKILSQQRYLNSLVQNLELPSLTELVTGIQTNDIIAINQNSHVLSKIQDEENFPKFVEFVKAQLDKNQLIFEYIARVERFIQIFKNERRDEAKEIAENQMRLNVLQMLGFSSKEDIKNVFETLVPKRKQILEKNMAQLNSLLARSTTKPVTYASMAMQSGKWVTIHAKQTPKVEAPTSSPVTTLKPTVFHKPPVSAAPITLAKPASVKPAKQITTVLDIPLPKEEVFKFPTIPPRKRKNSKKTLSHPQDIKKPEDHSLNKRQLKYLELKIAVYSAELKFIKSQEERHPEMLTDYMKTSFFIKDALTIDDYKNKLNLLLAKVNKLKKNKNKYSNAQKEEIKNNVEKLIDAIQTNDVELIEQNIDILQGLDETNNLEVFLQFLNTKKERNQKLAISTISEIERDFIEKTKIDILHTLPLVQQEMYKAEMLGAFQMLGLAHLTLQHPVSAYQMAFYHTFKMLPERARRGTQCISQLIDQIKNASGSFSISIPKSEEAVFDSSILDSKVMVGDLEYVEKHWHRLTEEEKTHLINLCHKEKIQAKGRYDEMVIMHNNLKMLSLFNDDPFPEFRILGIKRALQNYQYAGYLFIPVETVYENFPLINLKDEKFIQKCETLVREIQANIVHQFEITKALVGKYETWLQGKNASFIESEIKQEPLNEFLLLRKAIQEGDDSEFKKHLDILSQLDKTTLEFFHKVAMTNSQYIIKWSQSLINRYEQLTDMAEEGKLRLFNAILNFNGFSLLTSCKNSEDIRKHFAVYLKSRLFICSAIEKVLLPTDKVSQVTETLFSIKSSELQETMQTPGLKK